MELKPGYKQTDVGVIPVQWGTVALERASAPNGLVRGPVGGALKKEVFVKNGRKIYEQRNAIYRDATIGHYFINETKFKELKRFAVNPGDFIVSCSGTIGRIFKIPRDAQPGVINQALLKIETDCDVVDSDYFFHYFDWEKFQRRIVDNTHGGAMQNLVGMSLFRTVELAHPPLSEQRAIAAALSALDALLSTLDELIAKKRDLKQAATQQLLTGNKRLPGFSGEWEVKRLGDIAEIRDGTHQTPKYVEIGVPFFSVENVTNGDFSNTKFISEAEHRFLTRSFKIEEGDILMTRIGSIGDCKLVDWDFDASFYVSLALLKIRKRYSAAFICHYSESASFKKEVELNSLRRDIASQEKNPARLDACG
ncbi:MAG: restriction endonuclease subunit S [Pyrinomonadaceae bacterium]|nr:restriction endonuclease subunit S [Pyrinomonadaceae bacterium]